MSNKVIQIVSFNIPYPVNYGGVIDVFYKIVTLHQLGYEIHLHCFKYGREESKELEKYCQKIYYYERKINIKSFFSIRPYIVQTRRSSKLINELLKINAPILLEGVHTCFLLEYKHLFKNKIFVRTHNIENNYYYSLSKSKRSIKKIYFIIESLKLKRYEKRILKKADAIFSIQTGDQAFFQTINKKTYLLPLFYQEQILNIKERLKPYVLYQGDLSTPENVDAVLWIVDSIYKKSNFKFIIAGKNPSNEFSEFISQKKITLFKNPSEEEMNKLVKQAAIHLLYTKQNTGAKLKVLKALNSCGHVLVNSKIVAGTNLHQVCQVCETPKEFISEIEQKLNQPLIEKEMSYRTEFLKKEYSNQKNIQILIKKI